MNFIMFGGGGGGVERLICGKFSVPFWLPACVYLFFYGFRSEAFELDELSDANVSQSGN